MKIVLYLNEVVSPIACSKIEFEIVNGELHVKCTQVERSKPQPSSKVVDVYKENGETKVAPVGVDTPMSSGIVSQDKDETFFLTGRDLDDYNVQSVFALPAYKSEQAAGAQKIIIETKLYNILEFDSITEAVNDLIEQEKLAVANGANRIVQNDVPRYVFGEEGNENQFKLVKTALVVS